jgi:hypothetical protein
MFPTVQAVPLMDTWYEGGSQTPTRQSSRATLLTQNPSQAAVVFELSMWSILIGGTWYMKLWKVKHEPTLPNEASSTELEFRPWDLSLRSPAASLGRCGTRFSCKLGDLEGDDRMQADEKYGLSRRRSTILQTIDGGKRKLFWLE